MGYTVSFQVDWGKKSRFDIFWNLLRKQNRACVQLKPAHAHDPFGGTDQKDRGLWEQEWTRALKWCNMACTINRRTFTIMYQSNWSFNIPPGIWLCIVPGEGGILNVALEGWGIQTGFISYVPVDAREFFFFRFFQGLTDLQDRISPLLANNSFKRVFKRSLKVSLRHISLWKAWPVFDWRRNLTLQRAVFQY